MQITELPLGPNRYAGDDESTWTWAWTAIDEWYSHLLTTTDQGGVKVFVSMIMLACMYIPLGIAQMCQGTLGIEGILITTRLKAAKIALQVRVKGLFVAPNWFDEAAKNVLSMKAALQTHKDTIAVGRLQRMLNMWKLLELFTRDGISTGTATCSRPAIRTGLDWTEYQLKLRDMDWVLRLPADAMAVMSFFDPSGGVPIEGKTKAPGVITFKNLISLMDGELVAGKIVDAYMALLCHSHNGHFREGQLPGTPVWHAWLSQTPSSIKGAVTYGQDPVAALGDAQWPPALYPDAKLEDVGCHYSRSRNATTGP